MTSYECSTKGDLRIIHGDGSEEIIPKSEADMLAASVVPRSQEDYDDEELEDDWLPVSRGYSEEDDE